MVELSRNLKKFGKNLQKGVMLVVSKDCHFYNVLEWESRFTLELNAAKNTVYVKISFKQKWFKIKFDP